MILLDGRIAAAHWKTTIANQVQSMLLQRGKRPHLAAILVGKDPASETYIAVKEKACKEVGFDSTILRVPATITQEDLLEIIARLNNDSSVDGFIVQLPLPKHINTQIVIENISPQKDVDGFHPINVGRMSLGMPCFHPATPAGILKLLNYYNISTVGKRCTIIGRSNIVGKPMASLLIQKGYDATVTICHSRTLNLEQICQSSDIIFAALGVPEFLTQKYIKQGVVIIDIGISRVPSNTRKSGFKLVGDVKFDEVAHLCKAITPVPGGVGLMTIASLLQNTLKAAESQRVV